jgi:hypothetical protein
MNNFSAKIITREAVAFKGLSHEMDLAFEDMCIAPAQLFFIERGCLSKTEIDE